MARVDYENDADIDGAVEDAVRARISSQGREAAVLLASDYLKGVLTRGVMSQLTALKGVGTPLLVDPKIPHLDRYAGATLVTPNHQEAEIATHLRIRDDDDARSAALAFRARARCEGVLITRGEHGMWLSADDAEGRLRQLPVRWPTSPVRATRSSRPWRWRWPPEPPSSKRPLSRILRLAWSWGGSVPPP